jgi:cytochrome b6-f complex iron-sulfur subunit
MELNRRQFIVGAAGAAAGACVTSCAPPENQTPLGAFDIGTTADYSRPGIYDLWAEPYRFLLIHDGERLYASSAICTHKHCILQRRDETVRCPCHGSRFDPQGRPVRGPATQPLDRFGISRDQRGHVIVDTRQRFAQGQWPDPACYLQL